jgi:glycine hydroxymethyltransferase
MDPIFDLIDQETTRQKQQLNLIASENITSEAVQRAVGSALMHKYSEGNIGKRYYEGNQYIDQIEQLAIDRARELFKLPENWDVNVQALSGGVANVAAITAVLEPRDTILSMYLYDGGHLSHGWSYDPKNEKSDAAENNLVHLQGEKRVHIISKLFNVVQYKTDPKTQLLDYDQIHKIAEQYKPKLLITGGTAYPREIDYARMRDIAKSVGALYLADVAHEAGLIAGGALTSPVGIADIVTMTTHKTLRSARGAIILADKELIKKVNRAVLPGLQGGPFNNNIAGIAVGLGEALQPEFKQYANQVILNAKALATALTQQAFHVVSGGTDKHLLLLDLRNMEGVNLSGKEASQRLAAADIITNMNTIPWDTQPPANPSGLRLGTPLITTLGAKEKHMPEIARLIKAALTEAEPVDSIRAQVKKLIESFAG